MGAVLISLWACRMKSAGSRRFTKLLFLVALPIFASVASSLEIERKWQLRQEFAEENRESLTEDQAMAATADGANRTMGPVLMGDTHRFINLKKVLTGMLCVLAGGNHMFGLRPG